MTMENQKQKKTNLRADAFDRFSKLPESIVHQVMSLLPTKSATRMSALSRNFNSAWCSFPIFDFDHDSYIAQAADREPEFLDFVCNSLKRFPSNICMQRFSLRVWLPEGPDNRIDSSIRFAAEHNVSELILQIDAEYNSHCRLPRTALQCAKSLTVLKLSGFVLEFEDLIPSCNLVEDLSLERCSVSAKFIISSAKLTTLNLNFCKGLEKIEIDALNLESFTYINWEVRPCEINLSHCKNLKSLTLERTTITDNWLTDHVSKLVLLRNLRLVTCRFLQKIEIDALNLQSFSYINDPGERPCEINLSHCKNLKSLTLEGSTVTDDWLTDHVSKLVLLRNLKLDACRFLQKITISNQQLESFELRRCDKLFMAEIDAPNLTSFDYSGELETGSPNIILLCSTLAHAKVSWTTRSVTTDYYTNLRAFLSRFGHCKTLSLFSDAPTSFGPNSKPEPDEALVFPEKLRESMIPPLLDLRHLRVEIRLLSMSLTGLVDGLLWLAPNLVTMFIAVKDPKKPLMLNVQFYKWRPVRQNHMIKKGILVEYEGNDDDKKSLMKYIGDIQR